MAINSPVGSRLIETLTKRCSTTRLLRYFRAWVRLDGAAPLCFAIAETTEQMPPNPVHVTTAAHPAWTTDPTTFRPPYLVSIQTSTEFFDELGVVFLFIVGAIDIEISLLGAPVFLDDELGVI